jgi:hypothetical protein
MVDMAQTDTGHVNDRQATSAGDVGLKRKEYDVDTSIIAHPLSG